PQGADPIYQDAVYYCAQNGFNASCALSLDGGLTFGPGAYISNTPTNSPGDPFGGACSGLHGHLKVGPDGTAYVPIKGCGGTPTVGNLTNQEFFGGRPAVSVSKDNGTTWLIHTVPGGNNGDESDNAIDIDKRNLLDFNDINVDRQGRVLVAYAEACEATPHCLSDPNIKSTEAVDTVMRLTEGKGLVAKFDGQLH